MNKRAQVPAMVPLAPAAGTPLVTGAVLCAVSLVASARPLAIGNLPKISLPKLPDLDLPNFGKKKDAAKAAKAAPAAAPVSGGQVKVRAAKGVVAAGSKDAPTLAEVTGQVSQDTIAAGAGWKRFPERRMPGANMDSWKQIAKDIGPKL